MSREEKKRKIKAEITRNAIALFKEKGFDQVTVEEIALRSDIAKGTFFNYFPKKEHVLLHMADSYLPLMGQIFGRHQTGSVRARLERILGDLLDIYLQYADLLRITLVETIGASLASGDEETNISRLRSAISAFLEDARTAGEIRTRANADDCAALLVGLLFQTLILYSSRLDAPEMRRMLVRQLDLAWEGIADATFEKNL